MRIRLHSTLRALGLPLALGVCGGLASPASVSIAKAAHPHEGHFGSESRARLWRTLGIGWGDGYHTCRPRSEGAGADLPPATYYASPYAFYDSAANSLYDAEQVRLPWLAAARGGSPPQPFQTNPVQPLPPQPLPPQPLPPQAFTAPIGPTQVLPTVAGSKATGQNEWTLAERPRLTLPRPQALPKPGVDGIQSSQPVGQTQPVSLPRRAS